METNYHLIFQIEKTVYSFYSRAIKKDIWEKIMDLVVKKSREKLKKSLDPTYGIIDSQSIKTTNKTENIGFDGGKKN